MGPHDDIGGTWYVLSSIPKWWVNWVSLESWQGANGHHVTQTKSASRFMGKWKQLNRTVLWNRCVPNGWNAEPPAHQYLWVEHVRNDGKANLSWAGWGWEWTCHGKPWKTLQVVWVKHGPTKKRFIVYLHQMKSIQSLYRVMSSTDLIGSYGRFWGSLKNPCKHSLKADGVHNSWCCSMWQRSKANRASMSSWECPLAKKLTSAPAILCKAVHIAKRRRVPTFLTSLLQLSAWRFNHTSLKSTVSANLLRPWQMISAVRLLPVVKRLGERATKTRCPCTNKVVDVNRGRLKFENSLDDIHRLLGHACFWASMESNMAVISHSPKVVAPNRDRALAA